MPLQVPLVEVLVVVVVLLVVVVVAVVVLVLVAANTTDVSVVLVGQLLLILGEIAVNGCFPMSSGGSLVL